MNTINLINQAGGCNFCSDAFTNKYQPQEQADIVRLDFYGEYCRICVD